MATRFSNTLHPDCSVAANIQAWVQFVEDTLVATGGWVATSDTGQTLPSAMALANATNQKKGYRVYRMNDALQATAPVCMRLDYGSAGGSPPNALCAGIWPTIGMGSDGAGNITNVMWNGGLLAVAPVCGNTGGNATAGITGNSYGSADPGRFSLGMFISGTSPGITAPLVFTLERSKDETGADTNAGLLTMFTNVVWVGAGGLQSSVTESRYLIYAYGPQPQSEGGLSYALTGKNPSDVFGGNIGVAVPIHFKGIAQQPGTNGVISNVADISAEAAFSIPLYGSTRTYRHLNAVQVHKAVAGTSGQAPVPARDNVRFCMRND